MPIRAARPRANKVSVFWSFKLIYDSTSSNMATIDDFNTLMMQRPQLQRGLTALRKCSSTPTLTSLGEAATDENGMEVYVILRNFKEFAGGVFHRLPTPLRDGVRDAGICHYLTVFRQPDGTLVQFDFGPSAGGDIHVSAGPFTRFLNKSDATPKSAASSISRDRSVGGRVREHKLTSLPESHLYVGRTHLSMSDIRAWNSFHASSSYELHRSDCRHYVNSLVHYTTGVEKATMCALRNQWANNKHRYGLGHNVVRFGHFMTDVANWDKIKAVGHATTAVIMALTGQHALAKLRATRVLASVQKRIVPVTRRGLVPMPRALTQRPAVAVGATAVATYAASSGQTPGVVRDTLTLGARVAGGVQSALRAAASLAEHVGRSASAATMQTTNTAVALASGIAGAASRGTAGMMMTRPRQVVVTAAVATTTAIDQRSTTGSPLKARLPALKNRTRLALVAARR
ncbi:hypothetical protein Ndes2526A_g06606 [Nannochloris sp. 'desiccata']